MQYNVSSGHFSALHHVSVVNCGPHAACWVPVPRQPIPGELRTLAWAGSCLAWCGSEVS